MINVNKKILWLADYDLDIAPGGAQRSDKIIIDQGKLLGFNILKLNHTTYNSNIDLNKYDVLVTSNLSALSKANLNLIDDIAKHKYHVRIEHDSNDYLKQEDRIKLFGSCVKTVFLSDFHLSFFKKFYGDIFKNVEIIYDPIDTKVFKDYKGEREDKTLYSGYMHMLKGTYDFFSFALSNPDKKFVLAGWTDDPVLHHLSNTVPNVEYIGIKQYEDMPLVYNKYKYMFYSPNLNEPFCRSVAEAISCGMLLFTSKPNQIGCVKEISKVGIEKFKEDCTKAALTFWKKI
jgi:glycosyltransferase involved in cell wall biosynthesis